MPQSGPRPRTADSKRLQQLAASFDAYRRAFPRKRFPRGLREQAVAALHAGASQSAVCRACKLSSLQLQRWRKTAAHGVTVTPPARVLSVVEAEAQRAPSTLDDELELRIGPWHLRLRRAAD